MFDRIDKGLWWDEGLSLVEGCTPIHCQNCWSAAQTHMRSFNPNTKIKARYSGLLEMTTPHPTFNGHIRLMHIDVSRPLSKKKPTAYAVWNDLFHDRVPSYFVSNVMSTVKDSPHHVFFVLTQRPYRAMSFFNHIDESRPVNGEPLQNLVLGTTISTVKDTDRIRALFASHVSCRVLSLEPLLEDVAPHLEPLLSPSAGVIDGIFLGGPTGSHPGHMKNAWAMNIVSLCERKQIPLFFKAWGNGHSKESQHLILGKRILDLPTIPSLRKD